MQTFKYLGIWMNVGMLVNLFRSYLEECCSYRWTLVTGSWNFFIDVHVAVPSQLSSCNKTGPNVMHTHFEIKFLRSRTMGIPAVSPRPSLAWEEHWSWHHRQVLGRKGFASVSSGGSNSLWLTSCSWKGRDGGGVTPTCTEVMNTGLTV